MSNYIAKHRLFTETKEKPSFKVNGEIVASFKLNNNKIVTVTKSDTVNNHIVKACIYNDKGKQFCVRFKKEGFGVVKAIDLVVRYCHEEYIGVI